MGGGLTTDKLSKLADEAVNARAVTEEDVKLIKEWCLAAGQAKYTAPNTRNVNESKLAVDHTAVDDASAEFRKVGSLRLQVTLGKKAGARRTNVQADRQQAGRRQHLPPRPVVHQQQPQMRDPFGDARHAENLEIIREVAGGLKSLSSAMRPMAENQSRMVDSMTADSRKRRRMDELDDEDMATIMAFSGTMSVRDCQSFWKKAPYVEASASRKWSKSETILKRAMNMWSDAMGYDVDPCVYFGKRFMEDLLALILVPEEGLDFSSTMAGLTLLSCVFQNPAEIKKRKDEDNAQEAAQENLTLSETLRLEAKGARAPPVDYAGFKLALATFTALIWAVWGDECPLYKDLLGFCQMLKGANAMRRRFEFRPAYVRRLTWEVMLEADRFHRQEVAFNDFEAGAVIFPMSKLAKVIDRFDAGEQIQCMSFPKEWNADHYKKAEKRLQGQEGAQQHLASERQKPPQGGLAARGQHCDGKGGTHPKVKAMMKTYLEKFSGIVSIGGLCKEAGIEVRDLPSTGVTGACFQRLLGKCGHNNCRFKSVPDSKITETWADLMVTKLGPAVKRLVAEGTPAPRVPFGGRGGGRK